MYYPRLTVITPSFNQAQFLERTILSVISQNYPNLEYFVVDGGSTDGTIDIIRQYESHISWWVSEPDNGQAHAINKGLRRATGEWVGWQNSDDIYYPSSLYSLAFHINRFPSSGLIIGNMSLIDLDDHLIRNIIYVKPTYHSLLAEGMVLSNQASFWRHSLHKDLGFLTENLHYSFDYEWFLRLTSQCDAVYVNKIWGALRQHGETKSHLNPNDFALENALILQGREPSTVKKVFFTIRRVALMLLHGHFIYVLRGLLRRPLIFFRGTF